MGSYYLRKEKMTFVNSNTAQFKFHCNIDFDACLSGEQIRAKFGSIISDVNSELKKLGHGPITGQVLAAHIPGFAFVSVRLMVFRTTETEKISLPLLQMIMSGTANDPKISDVSVQLFGYYTNGHATP